MGRLKVDFQPGRLYEVSQDNNGGMPMYVTDKDCAVVWRRVRNYSQRYGIKIHIQILEFTQGMWLLEPSTPDGIPKLMRGMRACYPHSSVAVTAPGRAAGKPLLAYQPLACPTGWRALIGTLQPYDWCPKKTAPESAVSLKNPRLTSKSTNVGRVVHG